ncbi:MULTISPECIES: DUF4054 domain-containing protein [unclassified Sphingomonas]|uniref:DUF4054 domain-containing protein n=1 Tax=unclassified Sphingomonas TaxID=196159 RepID=UPI0006FAA2F9|nr:MULTISPECIES: DUF4054 domain-containing protein [unclassified Sphingomonas]KQX18416.1 hypothetical protein ASD17_14740 [Sphingomonas sp. Root1294]KQY72259.1 hypothetical protein ASD39_20235 [Sphingomonas sp. Root50]KRB94470.1 hypothetical protein ASE22_00515 [Sphingomonas sp. Root720]
MAYTVPDKATFTGLFPAFAAVTTDQYAFWSARAGRIVDPIQACLADDADLACMLLTAHYLTQQGIGTGADAVASAQGASGFKRIKSGSIDLERDDSSADAAMGEYGATSYGKRVYPMLKSCLGGPRVTGTGVPVCGTWPYGYEGPIR